MLLLDIVLLPLQASTCLSQVAHAAGTQTLIFLDRGRPDPPRLTFTATHTAVSRGEQLKLKSVKASPEHRDAFKWVRFWFLVSYQSNVYEQMDAILLK